MCAPSTESETDISQNGLPRKRFNAMNSPEDFLNNRELISLIERTIERVETSISEEHRADSIMETSPYESYPRLTPYI